jgi:hypothetical protein
MFADLDLARLLEGAEAESNARFVEAWGRAYPESGACWIEVAGARAMFDSPDSPTTQTFGLGMLAEPEVADFETLERFFFDRESAVNHEVSPLAGVPVAQALADRGYRPIEFTSVMYRPLAERFASSAAATGITVRPIERGEGALWAEISVRGWSQYPELGDFLRSMAPVMTDRDGTVALVAELAGEPIAAGALCLHGAVGILAGACTVPEARRRGAQLALLDCRLAMARQAGADVAMMCAVPGSASQRNAQRHGFRIAYTRTKWFLPLDSGSPG